MLWENQALRLLVAQRLRDLPVLGSTEQKRHDMTRLYKEKQSGKNGKHTLILQFSALASHATMSHRSGLLVRLRQGDLEVALVLA